MDKFFEVLGVIFYSMLVLAVLVGVIFLLWASYAEIKELRDIKRVTAEHNGTCYRDWFHVVCSYQGDKTTIINSNSKCYRNDVEINCSEIR